MNNLRVPDYFHSRPIAEIHPLSFTIACALLGTMEEKTKLGWDGKSIVFYKPDLLQGFKRAVSFEIKGSDIPFQELAKKAKSTYNKSVNPNILILFKLAADGLEKLAPAYFGDTETTGLIQKAARLFSGEKPIDVSQDNKADSESKELWDEDKIEVISKLFEMIVKAKNNPHKNMIQEIFGYQKAIESVMNAVDERIFSVEENKKKK